MELCTVMHSNRWDGINKVQVTLNVVHNRMVRGEINTDFQSTVTFPILLYEASESLAKIVNTIFSSLGNSHRISYECIQLATRN